MVQESSHWFSTPTKKQVIILTWWEFYC